ncbi:MAG: DUF1524 domain-containing protein [Candidatus Dadabacteria bacterium]|nr:DUF1524 domain-containing protein [Candidatus Dadabacteria bacterium]
MYDIILGRNEEDRKKFGTQATILLGKHYVKMGQVTSLSNKIFMDVAKSHVVFVVGKRGSGKSYTLGVIAESMLDLPREIRKNLSIIMLDTMGIYWTMKYPNKEDKELLKEWGLEAKPLNVNIFTPIGYYKKYKEEGIPTDFPFSIKISELSTFEWSETFNIDVNSPIGALIERIIETLKENNEDYDIDDIIEAIQKDDRSNKEIKEAAENRFLSAKHWGLFSKQGSLMEDLIIPGQITILDVSCYTYVPGAQGLRALVIGLVSQKLFTQRMIARKTEEYESIYRETHLIEREDEEEKEPLIWIFIDEAHEFIPNEDLVINLEHVIPENPSNGWGHILPEVAAAYYRRIGNLVLLQATKNSIIGNSSFKDKRKVLSKSSFILTQEVGKETSWDVDEIKKRQERLAKLAVTTWPL